MLGEALRLIRVYHDLKQKQVAERLEVSTSYLSEIERGLKTPTLDVIERYAKTFDMPMSSIMFFSESLDGKGTLDQARGFVAGKVLSLLQFLEARSGKSDADE
jgi:transcriptional regulator with XRE-family HTH domain